jgi:hypothetical protein
VIRLSRLGFAVSPAPARETTRPAAAGSDPANLVAQWLVRADARESCDRRLDAASGTGKPMDT